MFGGLGLAGLFTLFLTPVLYLAIAGLSPNRNKAGEAFDKELREAGDRGAME